MSSDDSDSDSDSDYLFESDDEPEVEEKASVAWRDVQDRVLLTVERAGSDEAERQEQRFKEALLAELREATGLTDRELTDAKAFEYPASSRPKNAPRAPEPETRPFDVSRKRDFDIGRKIAFLDFEVHDLNSSKSIAQISAISFDGLLLFNRFVEHPMKYLQSPWMQLVASGYVKLEPFDDPNEAVHFNDAMIAFCEFWPEDTMFVFQGTTDYKTLIKNFWYHVRMQTLRCDQAFSLFQQRSYRFVSVSAFTQGKVPGLSVPQYRDRIDGKLSKVYLKMFFHSLVLHKKSAMFVWDSEVGKQVVWYYHQHKPDGIRLTELAANSRLFLIAPDDSPIKVNVGRTGGIEMEFWAGRMMQPVWHRALTDAIWLRNLILMCIAIIQIKPPTMEQKQSTLFKYKVGQTTKQTWAYPEQVTKAAQENNIKITGRNPDWDRLKPLFESSERSIECQIVTAMVSRYRAFRDDLMPYDFTAACYFWWAVMNNPKTNLHNSSFAEWEFKDYGDPLPHARFEAMLVRPERFKNSYVEQPVFAVDHPAFGDKELKQLEDETEKLKSEQWLGVSAVNLETQAGSKRLIMRTPTQRGSNNGSKARQLRMMVLAAGLAPDGFHPSTKIPWWQSTMKAYAEADPELKAYIRNRPWLIIYQNKDTQAPMTMILHCLDCRFVRYQHDPHDLFKSFERMIHIIDFRKNPVIPFSMRFCKECRKHSHQPDAPMPLLENPPDPRPPPVDPPVNPPVNPANERFDAMVDALNRLALKEPVVNVHTAPVPEPIIRIPLDEIKSSLNEISTSLQASVIKREEEGDSLRDYIDANTRTVTAIQSRAEELTQATVNILQSQMDASAARSAQLRFNEYIGGGLGPIERPRPIGINRGGRVRQAPVQPAPVNRHRIYRLRYEERKD